MKRPQTKFHTDTMSSSKAIGSKKVNFLQHRFFLYRYFVKATTTYIDMLL